MSYKKNTSPSDQHSEGRATSPPRFKINIVDGSPKIRSCLICKRHSVSKKIDSNAKCCCPIESPCSVDDLVKAANGTYMLPDNMNFKIEFPIRDIFRTLGSPGGSSKHRDMNGLALLPYQSRDLHGKMKPPKLHTEQALKTVKERKLRMFANLNNTEMVEKYLTEQTDPNSTDLKKRTALHVSAAKGFEDVVKLLLENGANPNQKDSNGNTPLHLAACTSHFGVITILLKAGTNIDECDNAGYSPIQLAKSRLQMLKRDKNSSSEELKDQVTQIVDMMQTYLMRAGNSVETDLLDSFSNKLSISNSRQDVEDNLDGLLDSLKQLNLA